MEGGARLALDVLLWERASSEARSLAAEYLIACGRLADRHLQLQRRMKP